MSSYSSASLSSYDPASSASEAPSSPSTSPGTTPPSPLSLKNGSSFPALRSPTSSAAASAPQVQRNRALTIDVRPHGIGVDPASLVGKQLTRVRRSRAHPCITLQFADGSSFQVLVVGYDPHYRGIPKLLESDSPVLNPRGSQDATDVRLTVSHATSVTLSDKAFQVQARPGADSSKDGHLKEDRWTQRHAAFALKFEEEQGWHCVWATMTEYDERDRERCVFRNYADVYVDRLRAPAPSGPLSAPAHATTYMPFSASAPVSIGAQKGQKAKRKNRKKKSGVNDAPKGRW